jgi:hypothetical protein
MNCQKKILLAFLLFVFLPSCTIYTEKQSEALSRSVYLADDSFELGRFDVTDSALDQAVRVVKPPKERQNIQAVVKSVPGQSKKVGDVMPKIGAINDPTINPNLNNILVVPERFRGQDVVVVNSQEYNELLKDKRIFDQLKKDYNNLTILKKDVDDELSRQHLNINKMVIDLNKLQQEVIKKRLLILKLYILIAFLILVITGGVYLRMKGIL